METFGTSSHQRSVRDDWLGVVHFWRRPRLRRSAYVHKSGLHGVFHPGQTATLFGQTMGLVALTAALFALGALRGGTCPRGGDRRLDRRVRGADGDELRGAEIDCAGDRAAGGVRDPAGGGRRPRSTGTSTDPQILWSRSGRRRCHRGVRRDRTRPGGPVGYHPVCVLCADRAAIFGIVLIFIHSRTGADLRDHRAGDLRGADDGRLPVAAPVEGHRLGAADGRVDLP